MKLKAKPRLRKRRFGARTCQLCGRKLGHRAGRVSCTAIYTDRYVFTRFHAACVARSPAKAAAIMLGKAGRAA